MVHDGRPNAHVEMLSEEIAGVLAVTYLLSLVFTLGTASGASPATVASSVATFTPSTSILGSGGLALGGTFATANIQQF